MRIRARFSFAHPDARKVPARVRLQGRARLPLAASFLVVLSLASGLLPGCAGGAGENPFQRERNRETVVLRVDNRNLHDVSVFMRPGGRRRLVGKVPSRTLAYFEIQWAIGQPLDLELELDVGERFRLQPFRFLSGNRVTLTVASELRRSSLRQGGMPSP